MGRTLGKERKSVGASEVREGRGEWGGGKLGGLRPQWERGDHASGFGGDFNTLCALEFLQQFVSLYSTDVLALPSLPGCPLKTLMIRPYLQPQ